MTKKIYLAIFIFVLFSLIFSSLFFIFFFTRNEATAQFGLEEAENIIGPSKEEIPVFVGTIINWILSVLGIVLVAVIIYGGVMYATSAGNEERIESGKKIITYGIIGVAICLLAFLIANYTISALTEKPTAKKAKTEVKPGISGPTETEKAKTPPSYQAEKDALYPTYFKDGAYRTSTGQACGKEGDGCFYDYNCCVGYQCDTTKGNWNPFDNIPPGYCALEKE